MKRITKYNRKIKLAFRRSALAVCTIFVLAYPFTIDRTEKGTECYVLEMDGEKVGIVSDESMIKEAINNARLRLNAESESLTYVNPEYKVYKQSRLRGVNDTQDELEEAVYNVLKSDVISPKTEAYMVNIDGYTVTLASRDDVTALFEAVKAKYDKKNLFHVELVEETVNGKQVLTSQVLSATQQASNQNKVASSGKNNKKAATKKQEEKIKEGLSDIAFEENIEITKCYVDEKKITELKKAIHEVTKDKEKNQEYTVQSGDCLSVIAEKFDLRLKELLDMNPGLKEESFIGEGDKLVVTVPEPELSVLVSKVKSYSEKYSLPVEYVYNDNEYTSYEKVINEGKSGKRDVTAKITYKNGTEVGREILEEKINKKAVARVIEVGTLTPPTFIKPIYGGYLSSIYGARWGTIHKGVDWACPTGTSVNASSGGTVISAGWRNGYGYCVEIQHSDGKRTRYGHCSQLLVYAGQTVKQGEQIALSGNTGNSTGPHVHFEILVGGIQVDPFTYLQ